MANVAPLAPTLTFPDNNGYAVIAEIIVFTWGFNDPGDYQTRADWRYKKTNDPSWTTVNAIATTSSQYALPANTWVTGTLYEWQVSTLDNAGLASPWSVSRFVNTLPAVPAPTITSPTVGADQFATPIKPTWTLPGGFTQDACQIQRASTADGLGVMYYDSGTVLSTALTAAVPLDAVTGRTDYLRIRFRVNGQWSSWATVAVHIMFSPPPVPTIVVTQTPGQPRTNIAITNTVTSSRTNLCRNPNFATDMAGWAGSGASPLLDPSKSWVGSTSAKLTVPSGSAYVTLYPYPIVERGPLYTFSAYVTGTGTASLRLQTAAPYVPIVSGTAVTLTAAWQRISVTGVFPPSGVAVVDFSITSGTTAWFDGMLFEKASSAGVYFDGDSVDTSIDSYAWLATPNDSASVTADPREPVSVDLYRDGKRIAKALPVNGTYIDRLVGAGVPDYRAVVFAANGSFTSSA